MKPAEDGQDQAPGVAARETGPQAPADGAVQTAAWAEAVVRESDEDAEPNQVTIGAAHLTREQQVLQRLDRARGKKARLKEERITMAHGAGGKATRTLVDALFLDAFRNPLLEPLEDQAVFAVNGTRLAFTTDSFVVSPLFFPGGNIGD